MGVILSPIYFYNYLLKISIMNTNINNPNFIIFLDNITNTIQTHVSVGGYFNLTSEKKLGIQYIVFKLLKTSLKIKEKITNPELKAFVVILCKKNEDNENYEIASILNDIIKNFDAINEKTTPKKRTPKPKETKDRK